MEIQIEHENSTLIVKPKGEIDLHNSPQFRKTLQDVSNENFSALLVDLESVSYMDSSGLATLVEVFQNTTKTGKKLGLFSLQDSVKNILSITRLDEIFPIYSSRNEAIKEIT